MCVMMASFLHPGHRVADRVHIHDCQSGCIYLPNVQAPAQATAARGHQRWRVCKPHGRLPASQKVCWLGKPTELAVQAIACVRANIFAQRDWLRDTEDASSIADVATGGWCGRRRAAGVTNQRSIDSVLQPGRTWMSDWGGAGWRWRGSCVVCCAVHALTAEATVAQQSGRRRACSDAASNARRSLCFSLRRCRLGCGAATRRQSSPDCGRSRPARTRSRLR